MGRTPGATYRKQMIDLSNLVQEDISAKEARAKALIEEVQPITIEVPDFNYAEAYVRTHTGYNANYTNQLVYEVDKWLRAWHKEISQTSQWKQKRPTWRKYGFGELFEMIFGRPYNPKEDAKHSNVIARVFAYYSSKVQKMTWVARHQKQLKKVYTFQDKRFELPPYSLKLRVEEAGGWDAIDDKYGRNAIKCYLRLPKDNLKTGHARSPRTEANMQRRAAEAKARQNAIQNKATQKWKRKQRKLREEAESGVSDN